MPAHILTSSLPRSLVRLSPDAVSRLALSAETLEISDPALPAIPLRTVLAADLRPHLLGSTLTVHHANGRLRLAAAPQDRAAAFLAALTTARTALWTRTAEDDADRFRTIKQALADLHHPDAPPADHPDYPEILAELRSLARDYPAHWPAELDDRHPFDFLSRIPGLLEDQAALAAEARILHHERDLASAKSLFDTLEAHPLTREQRLAAIHDAPRTLVVAAAGSGKTSVLAARAAWLVRCRHDRPQTVLLLAFARNAAAEMRLRLRRGLRAADAERVEVSTFHALGRGIISDADGRAPSLSPAAGDTDALVSIVTGILRELAGGGGITAEILTWFTEHRAPYRPAADFRNWGEYYDHLRRHRLRTLAGELVRSHEECEIANFLFLHQVPYRYEAPYEHDVATERHSQYRPDFHLPEQGIYIEHFGIDIHGDTPPYVDREHYHASMQWKRATHRRCGTVLVETYSWERERNTLLPTLASALEKHGVTLVPRDADALFDTLEHTDALQDLARLIASFLHHCRTGGMTGDDLADQVDRHPDPVRARLFARLFEPVHERYLAHLARHGEIDFEDMIARATRQVETGAWQPPWTHILVDETQDIAPAHAHLLRAILQASPDTRLFCVGDDWQSIYRFAGSDVSVMQDFQGWFGAFKRRDLATTWRCNNQIVAASSRFLLQNPAQITKQVVSRRAAPGPAIHVGFATGTETAVLKHTLAHLSDLHDGDAPAASVLLLGRYTRLRPTELATLRRRHPRLSLTWRTVHGAKGLEADHVILIGLTAGRYGFPSQIRDDPLMDLVLPRETGYPHAEERRLFYVALTRARHSVYLLTSRDTPSPFVTELLHDGYPVTTYGDPPTTTSSIPCPACVTGRPVPRTNPRTSTTYYACTHLPLCTWTSPACPSCGIGLPVPDGNRHRCTECDADLPTCPACGSWLLTRTGPHGRFIGCAAWPDCTFTRSARSDYDLTT